MEKKRMNIKIPANLLAQIDKYAEEHGMTRTSAVAFILTNFIKNEK